MDTEQSYELIERYLSGQMEELERKAFEQRLANEAALREELDIHRELEAAVNEKEVRAFSDLLIEVDQANQAGGTESSQRIRPLFAPRTWWSMAAVALVLVGAYFILRPSNQIYEEELFAAHYETPSLRLTVRGDSLETAIDLVEKSYRSQDFKSALIHLQNLAEIDPENPAFDYYQGIVLLELDQAEEALLVFTDIVAQGSSNNYFQEAQWHQGLTYLKLEQWTEARSVFESMAANPDHYFSDQAATVLSRRPKEKW